MTVEILFENLMLYADEMNVRYLKQCMPDAQFIDTELNERPYFADNIPDLIYMGGMNEKNQEKAIEMLLPFKDRLEKLVDSGTVMLFTSNAVECLGQYIEEDDKQIPALGLFDTYAKREMFNRYGCQYPRVWDTLDHVYYRDGAGVSFELVDAFYDDFDCEEIDWDGHLSDHAAVRTTLSYTVNADKLVTPETLETETFSLSAHLSAAFTSICKALVKVVVNLPDLIKNGIGWIK